MNFHLLEMKGPSFSIITFEDIFYVFRTYSYKLIHLILPFVITQFDEFGI